MTTDQRLAELEQRLAALEGALQCDLIRLADAKAKVGVSGATLRTWEKERNFRGIYMQGDCAFVSRREFEQHVRNGKNGKAHQ